MCRFLSFLFHNWYSQFDKFWYYHNLLLFNLIVDKVYMCNRWCPLYASCVQISCGRTDPVFYIHTGSLRQGCQTYDLLAGYSPRNQNPAHVYVAEYKKKAFYVQAKLLHLRRIQKVHNYMKIGNYIFETQIIYIQ